MKQPQVESYRRKPKGFWVETMTGDYVDLSKGTYAELIVSVLANAFGAFQSFRTNGQIPELNDPGLKAKKILTSITAEEFGFFLDTLEESLYYAREAIAATSESKATELWQKLFGSKAAICTILRDAGTLLKPAAVSSGLSFPAKPLTPRGPKGFA